MFGAGDLRIVGVRDRPGNGPRRHRRGRALGRPYIDRAIPKALDGRINPREVFDRTVGLDGMPSGYAAMGAREALKVMVNPNL